MTSTPSPGPDTPPRADAAVRRATATDADAIGVVQAQVWHEAFAGVLDPDVLAAFDPAAFAQVWRGSLDAPPSPRHVLLIAEQAGDAVGLAALGPATDPDAEPDGSEFELLVLGVVPGARRGGHGSRLINAAADTARQLGATAMTAWLPETAQGTYAFLAAAGFAADGARRERVISAHGATLAEVRLAAALPAG